MRHLAPVGEIRMGIAKPATGRGRNGARRSSTRFPLPSMSHILAYSWCSHMAMADVIVVREIPSACSDHMGAGTRFVSGFGAAHIDTEIAKIIRRCRMWVF
jgi:hypothetical protein